ncbi:MAG: fumarate reductase/succinate dehydrogenase flavoprotein subunit [Gemmatimonadetes bacterium 13_2_20CM_2_65_7]|nr:MAG: fumarate reductase/succinate dehydrogenase flavoprotein subunit [Gemmatimonadetes bacterium 13_2_20CM_2_65_7]
MAAANLRTHTYDVVVIGAGGAGLRAAIEASAQQAKVALVCKSLLGKAHTVMAEGGAAAALGNVMGEDNWRVHFRDTMRGGKMHNNWRMAQILAQEAPDRIKELEAWGALFDRTPDGRINQRPFGGHTYSRLAHVGDRTGLEMIRVLQDKGVHSGIDVHMECTVFKLFVTGGGIAGALGYFRETGRFVLFRAGAIVLATGGIGKAWQITSNSWEYTGDGHALAYDAGAELIDMEFVQFHPTGMVWPPSVRGILVTEGVRGEGGVLKNATGERFMFRYMPDMFKGDFAETEAEADAWVKGDRKKNRRPPELLTRDVVSKAITREIAEGRGSPHGGVYLDIASKQNADYIKKKLPSMYHQFKELAQVDITKDAMEIGPTTHYVMGGVKVDAETQEATVPGLYAAGEVGGGMHGANRLGGNSLSDLLVFGRRAGFHAAEAGRRGSRSHIPDSEIDITMQEALAPFDRAEGENPFAVQSALQAVMQRHAGIIRDRLGLETALAELDKLKVRALEAGVTGSREYNPGWHTAIDLRSLLVVSEASARAALERTESRGAHTRSDYPDSDERQAREQIVIRKEGARMTVQRETQPPIPADLARLIKEGA